MDWKRGADEVHVELAQLILLGSFLFPYLQGWCPRTSTEDDGRRFTAEAAACCAGIAPAPRPRGRGLSPNRGSGPRQLRRRRGTALIGVAVTSAWRARPGSWLGAPTRGRRGKRRHGGGFLAFFALSLPLQMCEYAVVTLAAGLARGGAWPAAGPHPASPSACSWSRPPARSRPGLGPSSRRGSASPWPSARLGSCVTSRAHRPQRPRWGARPRPGTRLGDTRRSAQPHSLCSASPPFSAAPWRRPRALGRAARSGGVKQIELTDWRIKFGWLARHFGCGLIVASTC